MSADSGSIDWTVLSETLLFRGVGIESIEAYLENCEQLSLEPGELLLRPDRRNHHVYVLLTGTLRVYLNDTTEIVLNILSPGDCAGELSIIDNGYPTAYVVATCRCELVSIPYASLWSMVNASHAVARNLLYILTRRVRDSSEMLARHSRALREVEHHSTLDALTDLHNRRWMEKMFRREIRRCLTSGDVLTLVLLDVDHFKSYNDRYGHLMGDAVLRSIADALRAHMRANDMAARFGGDEFALLLPGMALPEASQVAQRLCKAVTGIDLPEIEGVRPTAPTLSVGAAQMVAADSLNGLIERADAALYLAKDRGRNRVEGYRPRTTG